MHGAELAVASLVATHSDDEVAREDRAAVLLEDGPDDYMRVSARVLTERGGKEKAEGGTYIRRL